LAYHEFVQDPELQEQADEFALDLGLEDIPGLRIHPPCEPVGFPRKRLGVEDFPRRAVDLSHEEAVACVCKTLQYAPTRRPWSLRAIFTCTAYRPQHPPSHRGSGKSRSCGEARPPPQAGVPTDKPA
jgi:hypothetical protein